MDIGVNDTKSKFVMAYMNFPQSFKKYLEHLRIVLEQMQSANLTVHPEKKMNLLGFAVVNPSFSPQSGQDVRDNRLPAAARRQELAMLSRIDWMLLPTRPTLCQDS
ncbi:hypothetical protein ANAPC5_01249 [Anaplasma phagocytophilum]|nr:hypothetical protein ANAPC5_01249 [Anaplasma phagocytophilum]